MSKIGIRTTDGLCPSYVYRPQGAGPWPAVLVYMDALAIRPAMLELGQRLASCGYFVLLPDLFYRVGSYAPMEPREVLGEPDKRAVLFGKYMPSAAPALIMSDTRAFLDFLAAQPDVRPGPIGTTGYCMGGGLSLRAAGHYPDEIAAAASYHGGKLATDAPDSPHLLAAKIKARVYVAGATDDSSFPDEMKVRLEGALSEAGVTHQIETYPARHGWVLSDMPVHDAAEAEHHWRSLTALFDATLKPGG